MFLTSILKLLSVIALILCIKVSLNLRHLNKYVNITVARTNIGDTSTLIRLFNLLKIINTTNIIGIYR